MTQISTIQQDVSAIGTTVQQQEATLTSLKQQLDRQNQQLIAAEEKLENTNIKLKRVQSSSASSTGTSSADASSGHQSHGNNRFRADGNRGERRPDADLRRW
eukprot:5592393-Pyramimonas_sp.AAC.1